MFQPRALVPLVLVCVSLLVARTEAAKPPRCPDGSYVVLGKRLVTGDPAAAPADLITIAGRTVSIESGCAGKRGLVKGTKAGTRLRVKWRRCGELRAVLLKALIDTACRNVTGTIKFKGAAPAAFDGVETSFTTTTTTPTTTTVPGGTVTTTTQTGSTSTTLRTCTDEDLPALTAVVANGGTLDFPCAGGSITIPGTLVVDGADVTLRAPLLSSGRSVVTLRRDNQGLAPLFRLFDVRGGSTLTLEGIHLQNGRVLGTNGANGIPGVDGNGGMGGTDQDSNPGIPGGPGGKGGDATQATAGEHGGVGRGGAMLIAAGSTVVLRDCRLENNGAIGGNGGAGGAGGRGGTGGAGGRGGGGGGIVAGAGGLGGEAGEATEGRDGGDGGDAQGGAIHNAGTLTIERCVVAQNFAAAGFAGRGAAGATGGGGGNGNLGGTSFNNAPSGQPSNVKAGGKGGSGRAGTEGKRAGNGGNGGNAFGGGIYSEGTLLVTDTEFRNNFASGTNGAFGASAGAGGGGGGGSTGGGGTPGGMGGNGADGANGAEGGSNGDGGGGIGGAIFSTSQPTLTNVVFRKNGNGDPTNTVASGSGGVNNCTPGDFNCFGAGGPGGLGGTKGIGGSNPTGPPAANGNDGNTGNPGANGSPGMPGLSGDPECHAGGGSCN